MLAGRPSRVAQPIILTGAGKTIKPFFPRTSCTLGPKKGPAAYSRAWGPSKLYGLYMGFCR